MGHEIDLKRYKIRTDLAIEAIENTKEVAGIVSNITEIDNIKITDVVVDEVGSPKIGKKPGNYITIEFEDVTDFDNKEKVKNVFSQQLKKIIDKIKVDQNALVLVIGLGNAKSTPDALGPLTIDNILVTNHLFLLGGLEKGFRRVCAMSPGVMGETGIETSDLILNAVKSLEPNLVIVIDALASQSVERLNKTIQMTDTGIHPGSGIGNQRKEISKEKLGIPVLAVGVPTVVDAVTIVSDTFNYIHKHFSYTKRNLNNPFNKLVPFSGINYLKKDFEVDEEDRRELFGMIGVLNDNEIKQLIFEVLTPIGYNLMVTPKEVDFIMEKLSEIIGNGINKALHEKVDNL